VGTDARGNMSTAEVTSLVAFCLRIPVSHVETDLCTLNRYSSFSEEINGRIVAVLAMYRFALNKKRLIAEGVDLQSVLLTVKTIVDAIQWILKIPVSKRTRQIFSGLSL